jgi:hypothetical protein
MRSEPLGALEVEQQVGTTIRKYAVENRGTCGNSACDLPKTSNPRSYIGRRPVLRVDQGRSHREG